MVCLPLIIVHTSVLSVMYRCQRYLGFLCIGGGGGGDLSIPVRAV